MQLISNYLYLYLLSLVQQVLRTILNAYQLVQVSVYTNLTLI